MKGNGVLQTVNDIQRGDIFKVNISTFNLSNCSQIITMSSGVHIRQLSSLGKLNVYLKNVPFEANCLSGCQHC